MTRRFFLFLLALAGLAGASAPAAAQPASAQLPAAAQPASAQLRAAAEQVVALLKGDTEPAAIFTPDFLTAVPAARLQAIVQQLRGQHGAALRVAGIEPRDAVSATVHIEMERATLHMNLAIDAQPPHRITGLLITRADARATTPAAIGEAMAALPGQAAFAVARLGDGPPQLIAGRDPERVMAIGSTFKLFILAELSRQIGARERRWNDVVALDRRSLPSGMLQNWPAGSPLTVHTLAGLMISISDNTATDALLHLVGRENVERMMSTIGVEAAARNRPFLGTLEIFALKSAPADDQQAWAAAAEAERRRLLAARYAELDPDRIDPAVFLGRPLRIGELEWFASSLDLVRTMDWLRRNGDDTTRTLLAINPGGAPSLRQAFDYIGFKGGSEPGVISMTWLVRNRAGLWHAVTGSWNNPEAAVDEARFAGLMQQALQLVN